MSIQILQNVLRFLERADVKGVEAYAWSEAHAHIRAEIEKLAKAEVSDQVAKGVEAGLQELTKPTEPRSGE